MVVLGEVGGGGGGLMFTLWLWLRPLVKWVLRRLLGLCELQRVCYGKEAGGPRALAVEWSLCRSRSAVIRQLVTLLDSCADRGAFHGANRRQIVAGSVCAISQVKHIKANVHPDFAPLLATCLDTIWSYRQLRRQLNQLRQTRYSCQSQLHEQQLLLLWQLLQPEVELRSRVSSQWKEIGFQGDDPATDFRGMGVLGLQCLVHLAEQFGDVARHLLARAGHPRYGYSFAIVGINIAQLAWQLVDDGTARGHFYNAPALSDGVTAATTTTTAAAAGVAAPRSVTVDHCSTCGSSQDGDSGGADCCAGDSMSVSAFHTFFVSLFYRFDEQWLATRPADIMQFGRVRAQFERRVRCRLADDTARLDLSPLVIKV